MRPSDLAVQLLAPFSECASTSLNPPSAAEVAPSPTPCGPRRCLLPVIARTPTAMRSGPSLPHVPGSWAVPLPVQPLRSVLHVHARRLHSLHCLLSARSLGRAPVVIVLLPPLTSGTPLRRTLAPTATPSPPRSSFSVPQPSRGVTRPLASIGRASRPTVDLRASG